MDERKSLKKLVNEQSEIFFVWWTFENVSIFYDVSEWNVWINL